MYIKKDYGFNDLKDNSWSGAVYTLLRIEKENKEEELMDFLEDLYFDSAPTETEVNDLLWFDDDYIYDSLGMAKEENQDVRN